MPRLVSLVVKGAIQDGPGYEKTLATLAHLMWLTIHSYLLCTTHKYNLQKDGLWFNKGSNPNMETLKAQTLCLTK